MRGFHKDRRRTDGRAQAAGFTWQEVEEGEQSSWQQEGEQPAWEAEEEPEQPAWQDTVDDWLPPEDAPPETPDEPAMEDAFDASDAFGDEPEPAPREIMATNRTIRLSCTLSAAVGPFALFLLFVEHESRAIRRFSLQSVGLSALHLLAAVIMLILGAATASAPVVGTALNVFCWIIYLCTALTCIILRIRLMAAAWQGFAFRLPLLGGWIDRLG